MEKTNLPTGLLMEHESSFGYVLPYAKCCDLQSKDPASDYKIISGPCLPASEAR
jgi:hypothetical protein